ncbi:MAG: DUF1634 domain-containing protein [Dehalococcoidales bacterium]|nr:DUF1634 domain-containing protein [Dehalococcoidales bacterium]
MARIRKTDSLGDSLWGNAADRGSAQERTRTAAAEGSDREREHGLEDVVRPVLRFGAFVSTALILAGVLLFALSKGSTLHSVVVTQSIPNGLGGLLSALEAGNPVAVISLGLLILILTPVFRVISTVVYSFRRRDWIYLGITSYVLLVLLIGFAVGAEA